jgi:hypothetical protein
MKFWQRFGIVIMSVWGLFAVHQGVNSLVRSHNWQPMTISDWGTWVGSIGTVGALIGTIWLATAEQRRRHRESMDLATLAAASLLLRLARMTGTIQRVLNVLEAERPQGVATNYRYCSETLAKADRWTNEDLLPLIPLRNHAAANLALVLQAIVTVQLHCEHAWKGTQGPEENLPEELATHLRIAMRALEAAMKECRRQTNAITQPNNV